MSRRIATIAARAGVDTDPAQGAVMPPLYLSSNYSFAGFAQKRRYDYTRSGNPTRDVLAGALAELEGGAGGVVTSSGMSAITLLTAQLKPEDLLIAPHDCYGGCYRLFKAQSERGLYQVDFIDFTDQHAIIAALARKPKIVWIETPSNPLLRITDIAAVARLAHAVDATVVVDNTFLSPALQQPIALGADLVVHSTTKYLNGHSDVVGGAVVWKDAALGEQIAWWCNCLGVGGAPFDSYLTLRGLRTLQPRLRAHQENANALVEVLTRHPAVEKVYFPALPSHPGHALAARQQRGFGAMLSFDLAGGESAVEAFVDGLTCFTLAESLGGVESLVAHPATMTHASMDAAARRRAGIGDGLVRVSVGIEATEDLVADFEVALDLAQASTASRRAQAIG
ncbi:MAG TPA: cystathionine gamma-synthase [Rhodanobacteraceae bacterium]|jgi:cystathionine gamma-synthase|nr:cystathionine gamma-synthase [Rhodanobacteraceae bacterium]